MINQNLKLNPDLFDQSKLENKPTRDGFGRGLVEAGRQNNNVVALTADLAESTRVEWFQKEFPDRFIEVGVAEQNLVTVASGMANVGKIPFITSYATFSPGRNWEQIRTTVCINDVPVKIVGNHAGLTVGPDGATHQALEDIAIMRVLPNMTVVVPADMHQAHLATLAIAESGNPAYLRLGRSGVPAFTTPETPFVIGKAQVVYQPESPDVTIVACGSLVYEALQAAKKLEQEGIHAEVINMHTVKPYDRETLLTSVKKTGAVVTAEEHQIAGGLGSATAEILAEEFPVPIEYVGVRDQFGQTGDPDELMKYYHVDRDAIMVAVRDVVRRK